MEFLNVFASVDRDQDLVIHEADLELFAAEMKYEKTFTRKWLRLFDHDKDGKFTFSDFCEALGLNEKVYEERLREVRKNIEERRKKQQEEDELKAERASRRANRLPQQQVTIEREVKEEEVKENVRPKMQKQSPVQEKLTTDDDKTGVEEDFIKPQEVKKIRAGPPLQNEQQRASPEEIELDFDDDMRSLKVEFADMEPKDLEEVKSILVKLARRARASSSQQANSSSPSASSKEFDRQMMHELDKKLGKTWQCQTNPVLNPKEVNYLEGNMAVLVDKDEKRVMVWKPQPAGGMCCCC